MVKNEKYSVVTVRFEKNEKKKIESEAQEKCMSLSHYIRHIMLKKETEDNYKDYQSNLDQDKSRAIKFLDNHLPFLFRLIISAAHKIDYLADKQLDKKELNKTFSEEYEIIKALGITVEEETDAQEMKKW
jgi:hypothetical protein